MTTTGIPRCWCGNTDLEEFSADYLKCGVCDTLVVAQMPDPAVLRVSGDEQGFYGRQYYESYLVERYGFPKLSDRAWMDLPERCLHWLRALLQYKAPPGRALELGSAHGAFVALLQWAGFDATGLELSPWLVQFARDTFGVRMLQGAVEEQAIEPGSLDVIAVMDVIEHLEDPAATFRHCADLLKPDGVFLLQTPRYAPGVAHREMVERNDMFLHHFKPEQHLFLFSERSIRIFFESLGAPHLEFLPAIFAHYDMFVAASRAPLVSRGPDDVRQGLLTTPAGRLVETLFQKDDALKAALRSSAECAALCAACEADRAARLEVIGQQGRRLGELEAERNGLRAELDDLRSHFEACELDRAARLEVIEQQGRELGHLAAERDALRSEAEVLRGQMAASEADRAARLEVIERQGRQLAELDKLRCEQDELIAELHRRAEDLSDSLGKGQQVLYRLCNDRVFRIIRSIGAWKWVEETLPQGAPRDPRSASAAKHT
jgi:SAM-dependent methyltransferase